MQARESRAAAARAGRLVPSYPASSTCIVKPLMPGIMRERMPFGSGVIWERICHDLFLRVPKSSPGRAPKDAPVTVKGWVRTRRDSKAGISFVHLSDGSSFHPVQVVVPSALSNYTAEVLHLTAGCAGRGDRQHRAVAREGPAVRDAGAKACACSAGSTIRIRTRSSPSRTRSNSCAMSRTCGPRTNVIGAATRVRHTIAQAIHQFFHERGFLWVNTPIITASDAEGAGRAVSRLDARLGEPAADGRDGKIDFSAGLLRSRDVPHVSGQLNVECYCLRALEGLYVRPDVSAPRTPTPAGTSPNSG
jgi:asparaginyl-tRNA synthetase